MKLYEKVNEKQDDTVIFNE